MIRSHLPLLAFIATIFAPLASGPIAAQNPAMVPPPLAEWPGAEIVDGVAFQGAGSISLERGAAAAPLQSAPLASPGEPPDKNEYQTQKPDGGSGLDRS